MPTTQGLGSSGVKAFVPPMGAPHAVVGGVWVGSSFPWTWTTRGSPRQASHPYDGWCSLGEVRFGRRFPGRLSLHVNKHRLLVKRPIVVNGSPVAPSIASPIA